ncbi:MAG: type III-A CRISPR-associated protein Csm2 [Bacteroidales bacterium]
MTNNDAIDFRKKIDDLESQIRKELSAMRNEKDGEKKKEIRKKIDKLESDLDLKYNEIFNKFNENIEIESVQNMNEQSVLFSEFFGRFLVRKDLSTSQIRNLYGEVMKLKMKGFDINQLILLKPRLAYITERKGTEGSRIFRDKIENALDTVIFSKQNQEKLFQNFANFFEAILAYHRSFGGK